MAIDIRKDIELSIMVADTWCPDSLAIDAFSLIQIKLRNIIIKPVKAIRTEFPIHQIGGMKDDNTRHTMHRCTYKIIILTDTDDIRISELIIKQWVCVCTVSIVCTPGLLIHVI